MELQPNVNSENCPLLNEELASRAILESLPEISKLIDGGVFSKPDMFIAVAKVIANKEGNNSFEIVDYLDLGNVDSWEYEYDLFAMFKLALSARTGKNSGDAIKLYQEGKISLEDEEIPGETVFPGSIVDGDIMAVCSSTDEIGYKDEIASRIVIKNVKKLINQ